MPRDDRRPRRVPPHAPRRQGARHRLRRHRRSRTPIELDHNALFHALRNEAFHASILTMKLDGAATKVLLRDVQMHPFKNEILHVDFQRIDENRKIHMKVPLHFVNGEISPAVKVSRRDRQPRADRARRLVPAEGPAGVHRGRPVELDVGHSIHVSALKLPPGVTVVSRGKLDPVVATAVVPKAQVEDRGSDGGGGRSRGGGRGARPAPTPRPATRSAEDEKGGDKKDKKAQEGRQEEVSATVAASARRPAARIAGGPFSLHGGYASRSPSMATDPSASSPASAIPAANTRARGTTRASGSPTRSRRSSARAFAQRVASSHGDVAQGAATCGS